MRTRWRPHRAAWTWPVSGYLIPPSGPGPGALWVPVPGCQGARAGARPRVCGRACMPMRASLYTREGVRATTQTTGQCGAGCRGGPGVAAVVRASGRLCGGLPCTEHGLVPTAPRPQRRLLQPLSAQPAPRHTAPVSQPDGVGEGNAEGLPRGACTADAVAHTSRGHRPGRHRTGPLAAPGWEFERGGLGAEGGGLMAAEAKGESSGERGPSAAASVQVGSLALSCPRSSLTPHVHGVAPLAQWFLASPQPLTERAE